MPVKRSAFFLLAPVMVFAAGAASALTLKSGEVLSSDGKVYSGASPEQRAAIVVQSKSRGLFGDGKKAGVRGSNIFVVVGEDVVFVPVKDVRGKSREQMMDIIAEAAGEQIGPNAPDASDLARGITEEHIEATKEQVSEALASVDIDEAARAATEAAWEGISTADLEQAVEYIEEHNAQTEAAIAEHMAAEAALNEGQ